MGYFLSTAPLFNDIDSLCIPGSQDSVIITTLRLYFPNGMKVVETLHSHKMRQQARGKNGEDQSTTSIVIRPFAYQYLSDPLHFYYCNTQLLFFPLKCISTMQAQKIVTIQEIMNTLIKFPRNPTNNTVQCFIIKIYVKGNKLCLRI